MKRPVVPQIPSSQKEEGIPFAHVGVVVDAPTGSNRIRVRLGNESGTVLQNVAVGDDIVYQSGDRILMINVDDEPRWIGVTRIMDTKEYGLLAGKMTGENEMHPPNNFTLTGGVGLVVGQWDAFTGNTVCWEVEHNTSASSSGATSFYTRGSYFLYVTTLVETRYVRVRAVRYDVGSHNAYYSRWSSWLNATSSIATGSSGELPVVGSGGQPHFQVNGPLAAATEVGGAYMFGADGQIGGIIMHVKTTGTAGETKIDINLHRGASEASIWVLEAAKPVVYASDDDNTVLIVSSPDLSNILTGDKLMLDIDSAATGAVDCDVVVLMKGSSEEMTQHAHSGGPHTGELALSELQDSEYIAFVRQRVGGDAGNWTTPGATSYNVSDTRISAGSVSVAGGSYSDITFPTAFTNPPLVFTQRYASEGWQAGVTLVTTTGCRIHNPDAGVRTIFWSAMGHM